MRVRAVKLASEGIELRLGCRAETGLLGFSSSAQEGADARFGVVRSFESGAIVLPSSFVLRPILFARWMRKTKALVDTSRARDA